MCDWQDLSKIVCAVCRERLAEFRRIPRWNVYCTRLGWGPAFMAGTLRAQTKEKAMEKACTKFGKNGEYTVYRIKEKPNE